MYIAIKNLPESVRRALNTLGYHRPDIDVSASESVSLNGASGDGHRCFACIMNLATGEYRITHGSWGGPNMFSPTNPVDTDEQQYAIPPDGAIIKGSSGAKTFARIYVRPETLAPMLPAAQSVTAEEVAALYCHKALKGGEGRRAELARYGVSAACLDGLVSRGFLKRNAAGACQITTEGRNALAPHCPAGQSPRMPEAL